jgi:uncharacterized protein (TIGR03435 family)
MPRIGLLALFAAMIAAQTPPAFEVASVKFTSHGRTADGWSRSSVSVPSAGRLAAQNSSLDELIRFAWQLYDYQVVGPPWLNDDSECFDIEAKGPAGSSQAQVRLMLQALLADRFKLAVHRETRTLPVYELVAAKGDPKLPQAREATSPDQRPSTSSQGGSMTMKNVSMEYFAYALSRDLKMPVFDKTGIKGSYDFKLDFDIRDSGEKPSLFSALQQQLGLKLESAKGPVEVLVVDHVEKAPTDN